MPPNSDLSNHAQDLGEPATVVSVAQVAGGSQDGFGRRMDATDCRQLRMRFTASSWLAGA